jgi:hypothetical protein
MRRCHGIVTCVARARLVDARTKAALAEAGCMQPPDGTGFDGACALLGANDAARVKTELAPRAARCIHFVERDSLAP